MSVLGRLWLSVSLLGLASWAAAQAPAPQASEEVVVTGSRLQERMKPVQGAKIFAGKKAAVANLDELPPVVNNNLRQAFAQIPGLLVSEVSNTSWASLSHRGLGEPHESWNILTLKDGVPVSPDMYNYPAAYYVPPMESVARIEFIRGGGSLLYGPQPGGVLNYVTRQPAYDRPFAAEARARFGADALRTGYAAVYGRSGTVFAKAYADISEGDGPRRLNSDFSREGASLTVGTDLAGGGSLSLTIDGYRGEFGEPGGLSLARFLADPTDVSTPNDRLRIDRAAASARLSMPAGEDTLIEALAYVSYYDRASRRQAGGSFGALTPGGNVAIVQSQKFRVASLDLRVRRDFAFGADGSGTVTAGLMAMRSDAPVTVDKGLTPADWTGGAGALARTERQGSVVALFAEALFDFGRFAVVPGVRAEFVRQSVTEELDLGAGSVTGGGPGAPNGPLDAKSNTGTVLLYGIGATYDLGSNSELFANVSRGFKPKLYNDGVTFQSGLSVAAEFDATYTMTAEAGLRGDPFAWLSFETSAFFVRFDNQIGFLGGPLAASPPFGAVGTGGARRQNVGTMENYGLDLGVELELFGAAAASRGESHAGPHALWLYANAQILEGEFTSGPARGFSPQYAPPYLARAGLAYSFDARFRIALQGTFVGAHNGSDNEAAEFAIPAYTLFDLTAEAEIAEGVKLTGGVNNLFDEASWSRVRPGAGQGIDPGAPRTWYLGLSAAF
jgi:Fe(3+) dicitrate transport protein